MTPMVGNLSSGCVSFARAITERTLSTAKPGDVMFLPSLRQRHFAGESTSADNARDELTALNPKAIALTAAAAQEALDWIRPLTDKGVSVVFEAPTPLFRSPPFRCADWFNSRNPICRGGVSEPRSFLERLRRPITTAMSRVADRSARTTVWDPFPVLCPGETCSAYSDGRPLFFDGDHLSAYGNSRLYDSFKSAMLRTMMRK
jgi:hypothetical protein